MKKIIKIGFFIILVILVFFITYKYCNPNIAVLCYHNIATAEEKENFPYEQNWTISIDNFREHLEYLKLHNYKTLTMEEFYQWKIGNIKLPYKSVLITFDDGFLSNYEYAFPLLQQYNMNATVFVVGSFIQNSQEAQWTGNIKTYMSKDILLSIDEKYPNIEIYSHSYNLHYQGAINQDKEILIDDIKNFNDFYKSTNIFCYPFGQYNKTMENALEESEYKLAFRYGPAKNDYKKASRKDNNFEIPRLNMSHGMNKLKFGLRLLMYK